MDYNIPNHVSPSTIVRAKRLSDNAISMDFYPGNARWGDKGDYLVYVFTNKAGHLILIYCCPYAYLVEITEDDSCGNEHTSYFMLKNIRHWLFKIKGLGFYDCEHIKRDEEQQ